MKKILLLITCTCCSLAAWAEQQIPGGKSQQPPLFPIELREEFPEAEQTFAEVKSRLLKHYYSDRLSEDALYYAAIQGMLRHVSPPSNKNLAQLWSPSQYRTFADVLQGVQTAIGLRLSLNQGDGSLTVQQISPNSPAEGQFAVHDRILRINGEPLRGKNHAGINQMLAGDIGTPITFTVVRDIEVFDITLTRRQFHVQNLSVKILDNLAYLTIKNVADNTAQELASTLSQLHKEGVNQLVIDLRNNGGGDFFEGLRMAESLLPKDDVILRILQQDQHIQNYVSTNAEAPAFEMIILVNQNTASSAEIFAAALRDHNKARLVGTRTHGKATVEGTYSLKNGYYAKFIIAAMYSPRGQSWHGKGLLPDYFIESDASRIDKLRALPLQQQLAADLQLATAWNLLKGK